MRSCHAIRVVHIYVHELQVFRSSFTFLYASMQPILPNEERVSLLRDLGGCVMVRPKMYDKITKPVYDEHSELDQDLASSSSLERQAASLENELKVRNGCHPCMVLVDFLPERYVRIPFFWQGLEESVRRLVIHFAVMATVLIQRHWRAWIARRKFNVLRKQRAKSWSLHQAATRVQAAMRRFIAVKVRFSLGLQDSAISLTCSCACDDRHCNLKSEWLQRGPGLWYISLPTKARG